MSVKHEIKSQLAKLLATEDLVVEHKKVETAQFNVHTRVLTLPMWEKASNSVYDMLVGHEVGHALYTPDIDWLKDHNIPPQFVNIVEDARIEKLMKRRYAGLSKTFYSGYQELADEDFFSIANDDISKMNFADRVNLYFKIGNYTNIPIQNGEEEKIIDLIAETETFADVLNVSKILYEYCEKEISDEIKSEQSEQTTQDNGLDNDFTQTTEEKVTDEKVKEETDQKTDQQKNNDNDNQNKNQNNPKLDKGGEKNENIKIKTVSSLEQALKDLVDQNSCENVYFELPKLDLDKIIVPNEEIHQNCDNHWNSIDSERFYEVDRLFLEFKRSAQKEVNYLVKEFECKKAADSYSRANVSRTGVLDCSKLHTYKYSEDLFKKVTTLADGKNHGLIFVLDWSGSMNNVMLDTVKQLYNLIWFCKKVSIPFEVYAFTTDYPYIKYDENGNAKPREKAYTPKDGVIYIPEWFSMMNIFNSKVNIKTLENQMKTIFRISYAYSKNGFYNVPPCMSLSGTPLNEALVSLHNIIPKFKQENKLQKVQCVILTDGEACSLKYHREIQRRWEKKPFLGTNHISSNGFLRDRKTGNTYSCDTEWFEFTNILLSNLKDNFKDTSFIGIRILESRDASSFIRRYCGFCNSDFNKVMNSWKKEKAFTIKNSGYHSYFGLSANSLAQDVEFEVHECATKTQIKSAFFKSLRSKKMNKKILGEFIELIV